MADLFEKTLIDNDFDVWAEVLSDVSDRAFSYATDNWLRNGKYFPKPANILELVQTYASQHSTASVCDEECKKRHGQGYGTNDLMWLWKKRQASSKRWTKADYESALKELDGRREGGPPAWRRA